MARVLRKLSGLDLRKVRAKTPRVLLIRLDYLGDMLSATPLLAAIREKYPACYLAVLGYSYNRCVIENNPDVDDFFHYIFSRERTRNPRPGFVSSLLDRMNLVRKLRAIGFDYVIIPNGGRYMSSVQFAWQLGAQHVVFNGPDTAFDDLDPEHIATRTMEHEAIAGFRVARDLVGEVAPEKFPMKLIVPPACKGRFRKALPADGGLPVVAINFSAREEGRIWGVANCCALAVELARNNRVIVFGSPGLWSDPEFLRQAPVSGLEALKQAGRRVAYIPTADFDELTALIDECDILVSSDGGPLHMGAALGKPIIALFENRPEKYKRWYPWGVKHEIVIPRSGIGVKGIAVQDVLAACGKLGVIVADGGAAAQSC